MNTRALAWLGAALVAAVASSRATAAPLSGSSNPRDYLVVGRNLNRWSVGLYGESLDRDVTSGGVTYAMTQKRFVGRLGYDVFDWVTAYGLGGSRTTEIGDADSDSSSDLGGGLTFHFLDQMLLSATLLENALRIDGEVEYVQTQTDWGRTSLEWSERSASLLFRLVNELDSSVLFSPHSIGIFAGPAYSDIEGDLIGEDESFGFIGGLEVFCTERVAISFAAESFGDAGFFAGVNIGL